MTVDRARLRATLGQPELSWLVGKIRLRLERGRPLSGSVALQFTTTTHRAAVDKLLGRPPSRGTSLRVSLDQLEAIVRDAGIASSLSEAIEELTGPIRNLRELDETRRAEWAELWQEADQLADPRPEVRDWLSQLKSSGVLQRLSRRDVHTARRLLTLAIDVIRSFPRPLIHLAELATEIAGDAHALDPGQPLGTLLIRAAARFGRVPHPSSANGRRDAWESVGVLCDELSAPVLTLNLSSNDDSTTGRALRLHTDAGEPYRLSIRQIRRERLRFDPLVTGKKVYVCENPSVVDAAANRLGRSSVPLICTEGQPRTAVRLLLDSLRRSGIELAYHGDFDWEGLRIANLIMGRHDAQPWRLSAEDYLCSRGRLKLKGTPVAACWDERLQQTMESEGYVVHEEQVVDRLIRDLEWPSISK